MRTEGVHRHGLQGRRRGPVLRLAVERGRRHGCRRRRNIIFRKEIAAAPDPEARRAELVADYTDQVMTPYAAAERGLVDDVIDPRAIRSAVHPHRKYGNVPL
jgi:acetyl-CoA carboxylase carboxyltransferase component